MAKLDLSEWAIPIPNEWTDRVYLAANDGQVMCLRHRDLLKPLPLKTHNVIPQRKRSENSRKRRRRRTKKRRKPPKWADSSRGPCRFSNA